MKIKVGIILLLGFLVRIILSAFGTLHLDQNTFIAWSNILAERGFTNFYRGWSDYLPGYLYILWLLAKIKTFLPIPDVILYKLPAILADIITGFLIYKIVEKNKSPKWGIILASLYIFNPAVLANSTFWGQVDSFIALFAILAVWLMGINVYLSAAILSFGTLIKPQTAFIAPVILFLAVKEKWPVKKFLIYIFIGLTIFIIGFLPFAGNKNLLQFIIERISLSANQYPYTSINAFNFWGLFGFWKSDQLPTQLLGYFLTGIISLITIFKVWKRKGMEYLSMTIIFISSFFFLTRMHERHFLPAFAPLLISASISPVLLLSYVGFSITYIANLFYSFNWISYNFVSVFSSPIIKIFILFNLALFVFTFYFIKEKSSTTFTSVKHFFADLTRRKIGKEVILDKIKISPKKLKIILAIILVFAFFTRVFQLQNPPNEYFDEVYHAFTARQILNGNPKAWEWWNTPPPGFAYEWTHPPLAKLGMVLGMLVMGENSFGWRIPGAFLGVGSVYLVYLLAKKIFDDELIGILSAAVFSLDGLPLVISRIGMNDSYFLFFALLSIYFFLKEKDFFSAAALGLALASKWSTIWAIPILGLLWLRRKKKFKLSIFWFLLLPFTIYLLSYTPMFLTGHNLSIFWGMQKQMWWYHTNLKATHPYTSLWWSWPFMIRPVYLYTSAEISGWVSRIYAIGNPLVFWFGFFSVVLSFIYSYFERNKNLAFVVFAYLIFFVPWAASPRIMFIYHYLPSIPFLAIATGYVLRRNSKLILPSLIFSVLLFLYFYPHWAGLNIPLWLDKSYYWFASWR